MSTARSADNTAPVAPGKRDRTFTDKAKKKAYAAHAKATREAQNKATGNVRKKIAKTRTFSQPSVMSAGDTGIFVTSEKGREKNALLELNDLVHQYLEDRSIGTDGLTTTALPSQSDDSNAINSVEADILAELAELKGDQDDETKASTSSKPIHLITLDIPCVSFLRFPTSSMLDPVKIVHELCLEAAGTASIQQSRFVKRMTPVCGLVKTLNQGLEKTSDQTLPPAFDVQKPGVKPVTFAIRPTIRNNDKLDRDTVIRSVADKVQQLGQDQHKVNLREYEKAILVEVYRSWIAMSVVDNLKSEVYSKGYEELKRFNLAEIYASKST